MASNNPHLLKRYSLFAMFCLSYLPLFILLIIKVLIANEGYLHYAGFNKSGLINFFQRFGFVLILVILSIYAFVGTGITFNNIKKKRASAFPVKLRSLKPKNEEALSYLATYVIPLLMQGNIGVFGYATFGILFIIYYKLYSTSSLILINPVLNLKYGLYEVEYVHGKDSTVKNAMIVSQQQWLDEDEELKIIKLSHRLYFAF